MKYLNRTQNETSFKATEKMTTKKASEVIDDLLSNNADLFIADIADSLTKYTSESWQDQYYADNMLYESISPEGTSIKYKKISTSKNGMGNTGFNLEVSGSDATSFTATVTKTKPLDNSIGKISAAIKLDYKNPKGSLANSDDTTYVITISAADQKQAFQGNLTKFSGGSKFKAEYMNGAEGKLFKFEGSDTYAVVYDSNNNYSVDWNVSNVNVIYKSAEYGNATLSVSGDTNSIKNSSKYLFKDVTLTLSDYSITAKKVNFDTTAIGLDQLLGAIPNLDMPSLIDIIKKGDNKYQGKTTPMMLDASFGNDTVMGGSAADTLIGGAGNDQLTGGRGSDVFSFTASDSAALAKGSDQIKDFRFAEGDQLKLQGLTRVECHVSDVKVANFAAAQSSAHTKFGEGKNVSIQFVGANGLVFVDFDGNFKADSVITLTGLKVGNSTFTDYAESGAMFFE
jgi:hypothetical protein